MTLDPDAADWIKAEWSAAGTTTPSLLERKGIHEMRERTAQWCRRHPTAASALPGWDPHLLARVLESVTPPQVALPPPPADEPPF
jgi:hypothetical protein